MQPFCDVREAAHDQSMTPPSDDDRRMIRIHCDWFGRNGATDASINGRRENLLRLAHVIPCDLMDASPAILDAWQSQLTRRPNRRRPGGLSANTIATYTAHVRGFYTWAFEDERLATNPAARLPKTRRPRGQAHPIPERDLVVALYAAHEPIRTWLLLAAFMGLRCMEIAQLRRDSVHEVEGRLILVGEGKGRKPFRLTVPQHIEPALRQYLTVQGPLWTLERGGKLTAAEVSRKTGRFFRRQGMPYSMHWARHSFGTASYQQTKDLLLTQDLMRHSTPELTRIYVQTTPEAGVQAMDQLAERVLRRSKQSPPQPPEPPAHRAA